MEKITSITWYILIIISLISSVVALIEVFGLLSNNNKLNTKIFFVSLIIMQVSLYLARKIEKHDNNKLI